jgi:hypothetical protein
MPGLKSIARSTTTRRPGVEAEHVKEKPAMPDILHKAGVKSSSNAAALGTANWLCLAAAPTFAIMALLTGVFGGGAPDILCSTAHDASPLGGMALMYWLMTAFHSAPWLKLISSRHYSRGPERLWNSIPNERTLHPQRTNTPSTP